MTRLTMFCSRPGASKIFTATFKITGYLVSRMQLSDNSEKEAICYDVTKMIPRKLAYAEDMLHLQDVYLSFDDATADHDDPLLFDGSVLTITGGTTALVPGMFVGTAIDFDTGTASGPFNGQIQISFASFTADFPNDIPAVSEWGIVVLALLVVTTATIRLSQKRWQVAT